MKHQSCLGRIKTFIMRRQRLMGFIILMLFNVLFHIILVRNEEETRNFYSNVPTPSKFFNKNSTVLDFPLGNEEILSTLLLEKEVFVMFYAPWSVHCTNAREHFDAAAKLFKNKVHFVAINCWHAEGSCRQKRNLISFPGFYYYKQDFEGFRYFGTPRSDVLVHFVELMLDPIEVVNTKEHLMSFIARHETSIISYFNFASTYEPLGFDLFYLTALKFIEADTANVLKFAITSRSSVASLISLHSVSSVILVKKSKPVMTYVFNSNSSYDEISQWINTHKGEPSIKWLQVSKMKSLVLSNELKKGPALLLFLPYYPLSLQHEAFFEMLKVSLTYYGCNETQPIWNKFIEQLLRKDDAQSSVLHNDCEHLRTAKAVTVTDSTNLKPKQICCMFVIDIGRDVCIETHANQYDELLPCQLFTNPGGFYSSLSRLYSEVDKEIDTSLCFEIQLLYLKQSYVTVCSRKKLYNDFGRAIRQKNSDDIFNENMYQLSPEICSKWKKYFDNGWLYNNRSSEITRGSYSYPDNFIGSGCHNNQSIRFYVLDFYENDAFIFNLGFQQLSLPTLIFADVKREVLSKLDDYISESNLVHFITLHQNSDSIASHFRDQRLQDNGTSIVQITSSNFIEHVLCNQKTVVVLYYSKWCGFCSTFAHVYITLAKQFDHVSSLSFTRIDADSNDISQQHASPYYPSIVMFRNNESIPYPKHSPRSLSYLMSFVQHRLTSRSKMYPSINSCNKECISTNIANVRKKIKSIVSKITLLKCILSKNILGGSDQRCMERELHKMCLEMKLARTLFRILHQSVTKNYLEKHKLLFLSEEYAIHRRQLKYLPECH